MEHTLRDDMFCVVRLVSLNHISIVVWCCVLWVLMYVVPVGHSEPVSPQQTKLAPTAGAAANGLTVKKEKQKR